MSYTVKIEQTYHYPNRMKYIAQTDSFVEKEKKSLFYERNIRQPYGWIKESGTPPCDHLDVIVMTDKEYALGEEDQIKLIGVFRRNDGDHKLVGVPVDRGVNDFSELSDEEKEDMHRLSESDLYLIRSDMLARRQNPDGICRSFFLCETGYRGQYSHQ